MTAEEWDVSTDYDAMRWELRNLRSTRKWYCLCLACVRLIEARLSTACKHAIEVTDRYIERKATNSDRSLARAQISKQRNMAEEAVYWATAAPTDINSSAQSVRAAISQLMVATQGMQAFQHQTEPEFARLLREVFANPLVSPASRVEPAWLRWGDGAARRIAETILDEGDFERVGVLADALEDAGCTDERILSHLRSPGPHVRGCWALDLVLGKS